MDREPLQSNVSYQDIASYFFSQKRGEVCDYFDGVKHSTFVNEETEDIEKEWIFLQLMLSRYCGSLKENGDTLPRDFFVMLEDDMRRLYDEPKGEYDQDHYDKVTLIGLRMKACLQNAFIMDDWRMRDILLKLIQAGHETVGINIVITASLSKEDNDIRFDSYTNNHLRLFEEIVNHPTAWRSEEGKSNEIRDIILYYAAKFIAQFSDVENTHRSSKLRSQLLYGNNELLRVPAIGINKSLSQSFQSEEDIKILQAFSFLVDIKNLEKELETEYNEEKFQQLDEMKKQVAFLNSQNILGDLANMPEQHEHAGISGRASIILKGIDQRSKITVDTQRQIKQIGLIEE